MSWPKLFFYRVLERKWLGGGQLFPWLAGRFPWSLLAVAAASWSLSYSVFKFFIANGVGQRRTAVMVIMVPWYFCQNCIYKSEVGIDRWVLCLTWLVFVHSSNLSLRLYYELGMDEAWRFYQRPMRFWNNIICYLYLSTHHENISGSRGRTSMQVNRT